MELRLVPAADAMTRPPTPPVAGAPLRSPMVGARRLLFFGLTGATTLVGSAMMLDIVRAAGVTALEIVILTLFVPTFGWIALTLWSAVTGFVLLLSGREPITLDRAATVGDSDAPIVSRTALVMPAHNEDPHRVLGGLRAIVQSLEGTGQAGHFDVHLLSDTTDPDLARLEEAGWQELRADVRRPGRLHYRRRAENLEHKAGNIADFCAEWGERYDFMIVLDADSLMSGSTIVELVRTMQANPRAGLMQTVPLPARQETLFGRFVQFAGTLYGPMLAAGHAFWQVDTGNYWGHNAIVRVQPFVEHARLPVLPGTPPLGGRILSHDFVEAALLRRAGWLVYILPALGGSWEEVPTNVVDYAVRDRRWAQGSLQHLRLLRGSGFHPLSRLHLTLGAMGYVASVLWLLMLLASTAYVLIPALSANPLFGAGAGGGEGARVGVFRVGGVPSLLILTGIVLFLPKLLGLLLALVRRRREFGGAVRLIVSAFVETLFSILIAPVMMMYHTKFVFDIVSGRTVDWGRQSRASRTVGWSEAIVRTRGITLLGAVWAGATLYASPLFFLWLSPIFAGLLLAAPLVRSSGSTRLGHSLRRGGILSVPSEITPPGDWNVPGLDGGRDGAVEGRGRSSRSMGTAKAMHEAERGLFELRRGRPLCVMASGDSDSDAVLCSAVEGLDPAGLDRLKELGSGPLRLVVTAKRASAMGVGSSDSPEVSLALNGESTAELLRLSSAEDAFDASRLVPRAASGPEADALALVRFGGLLPAVVTTPADPERVPELRRALDDGSILAISADRIRALSTGRDTDVVITHVSEAQVPLEETENARFMLFREGNSLLEHVAVLVGDQAKWPDPLPVRLHSACLTGDLFGSLRCDCGEQLRGALRSFANNGGGVLLYLQQEGRGIGLGNKLRAYALQHDGHDTIDADRILGFGADERSYDAAVGILQHLGIERVLVLTNNPEKVRALEEGGIEVVGREPLHGTLNRHNLPYVRAKVQRAGHWLGDMLHDGFSK